VCVDNHIFRMNDRIPAPRLKRGKSPDLPGKNSDVGCVAAGPTGGEGPMGANGQRQPISRPGEIPPPK